MNPSVNENIKEKNSDFLLMTIKEAAEYLHIPLNTLYKKYKDIPHVKIGNTILFCKIRLNEWLEKKMKGNRN